MSLPIAYKVIGIVCVFGCLLNYISAMNLENIVIVLEPFNELNCETSCKNGLKEYIHRLTLRTRVHILEPLGKKPAVVSFQWKKESHSEYKDLQKIHLDACTEVKTNDTISCTKSQDKRLYHIYLNVTAQEKISQARVILKVIVDDITLNSGLIVLPVIHKLTHEDLNNMISLKLHDFNQSNCITNCNTGLLTNVDRLILVANIALTEQLSKESVTASFQWKNDERNEYVDLNMISLNMCSGYVFTDYIYCTMSESGMDYMIYLNMTADELLSGKKISIKVFVGLLNMNSSEIILPWIQSAADSQLSLNGKRLNKNDTILNFTPEEGEEYLQLCCESVVVPCYAIITPPDGPPIIETTCARYQRLRATTYKLGYVICGVQDYKEHITLHVYAMQPRDSGVVSEVSSLPSEDIAKMVLGGLLVTFLIAFGIGFCFKKCVRKKGNIVDCAMKYLNGDDNANLSLIEDSVDNSNSTSSETQPQSTQTTDIPMTATSPKERRAAQFEAECLPRTRKYSVAQDDKFNLGPKERKGVEFEAVYMLSVEEEERNEYIMEAARDTKNEEEPKKSK